MWKNFKTHLNLLFQICKKRNREVHEDAVDPARISLFDDILNDDESLFINEQALDWDYVPSEIPLREKQQHYIADVIKPLFQGKSGRNLFITGPPEIDKVIAVKHVLRELEEKTNDIYISYIDCQKKETSELRKIVSEIINEELVVIAFEDVENLKEGEILNTLSKSFNKKCILMISDDKDWLKKLNKNIKSSLNADVLKFKPYNLREIFKILKKRASYAFYPGVIENRAIKFIAKRALKNGDFRAGIFLLRESGNIAEMEESKKISKKHCKKAIEKLDSFLIKKRKSTNL
ncbi:hypothetical protein HOD29_07230 [archaeon]|nr:hypothetical protein [archaeon]